MQISAILVLYWEQVRTGLAQCSEAFSEVIVVQAVKKLPAYFETRGFITMFTRARYLFLS
jgi:hypothetical protein